ncbi:hypothetical protein ACFTWS_38245 [Streptomyces sp. NPDC057027]|uniref:hypothetical protein n=1 Tax=Streptomyces sp. NPDC057027 TaxID=3346004 RepID=UPI003630740A
MALDTSGQVYSWGDNAFGQPGNGATDSAATTRPVSVQSLNKVKDIAAGCYHAAALRDDGSVRAWGGTPADSSATAPRRRPRGPPWHCRRAAGSRRSPRP